MECNLVKRISRATGQLLSNDMAPLCLPLLFHPVVNTRNELPNPCSHSLEQWADTKSKKQIQLTDAPVRNVSPFHVCVVVKKERGTIRGTISINK